MTIKNTDLFYVQRPDGADEGSYKIKYEDLNIPDGGIDEAPEDGKTYGRKDKSWTEVTGGGGGGDVSVEDDGTEIVATASTLNFTGDGVTVTANGNTANIAIPGGGGGGDTIINYNGASAWGDVAADGTLNNGLNCTITKGGTGIYTVNFVTPMPNANYSVVTGEEAMILPRVTAKDANGFTVTIGATAGGSPNADFSFAVFATNALPPKGTTGTDAWAAVDLTTVDGACNVPASYNIASVTRNGQGIFEVLFTTPMPTENYSVVATTGEDVAGSTSATRPVSAKIESRATTGFTVEIFNSAASGKVDSPFSVVVNATNANLPLTVTQEQIEAAINNPGLSAWCSTVKTTVNGPVPIANGSNVASVTRTSAGVYDIVFTTPMPNADYAVASMTGGSDVTIENAYGVSYMSSGKTANGFTLGIRAVNGAFQDQGFDIHVASTNALPPRGTTGADGWGQFDGTTVTTVDGEDRCNITASYNIEKVVRTSAGVYVVHFTTDMPTGSYAVVANTNLTPNNNNTTVMVTDTSTDTCTLNVKSFSNTFVNSDLVTFTVHATNANLPATITQEQIDALVDGSTYKGIAAWAVTGSAASAAAGTVIPILGHNNIRSIEIIAGLKVQVLFETPMPDTNYSVVGTAGNPNAAYNFGLNPDDRTVNGFTYYINAISAGTNQANVAVNFAVIALNAAPPRGTTGTDAWGYILGNQYTLAAGYNCTTAQNGTSIDVTFNTPMPSANYAVSFGGEGDNFIAVGSQTANGFTFTRYNSGSTISNQLATSFSVNATNAQLPATITQEQIDALIDGNTYNGVSAWGNIAADNTINGGLNIASVTSAGAASALIYTVTFETPMPNADYSVVGSMTSSGTLDREFRVVTQTATEFTVGLFSPGGFSGAIPFNFIVTATNAAPPRGGTGTDAWATVTAGSSSAESSYNIDSVVFEGSGVYTLTFTNPMPNTNYSVVGNQFDNANGFIAIGNKTTESFQVTTNNASGAAASNRDFSVTVNATNANLPATITTDQIAALIQNPVISEWGAVASDGSLTAGRGCATARTAAGTYTVTFNTEKPNNGYSVTFGNNANLANVVSMENKATTGFTVTTKASGNGANQDSAFDFQVVDSARNGTLGGGADAWASTTAAAVLEDSFNLTVAAGGGNIYNYSFINNMPNADYSALLTPEGGIFATTRVFNKTANGFSALFQDVTPGAVGNVIACNHSVAVFATDGNAGGFWVKTGAGTTEVLEPVNSQATIEAAALTDGTTTRTMTEVLSSSTNIVQMRAFDITTIGVALTTTAWTNIQTNTVNFTPVSDDSTIIVDYVIESRQNNVLSTNIQVNLRSQFGATDGAAWRQSIFSNTGGDGGVFPVQIRNIYANTDTNAKAVMLQGQMNQTAGNATFDQCTLVITEITN